MSAILATDVNPDGDNVMIYTSLSIEELQPALDACNISYSDLSLVEEDEIQHYLAEPLHLSAKVEARWRKQPPTATTL